MMSSIVLLKDVAKKRRHSAEPVNLEKAETALVRRPRGEMTASRAPRRSRPAEPLYAPPIDSDIEHLLRSHAVQSSMIANAAAVSVGRWLAFLDDPACSNPRAALETVHDYERLRRSAIEDLRRTAALVHELHRPPLTVAARVMEDRAEFAITPTPAQLGPVSDEDLANAYTEGALPRRQLKEWRS